MKTNWSKTKMFSVTNLKSGLLILGHFQAYTYKLELVLKSFTFGLSVEIIIILYSLS